MRSLSTNEQIDLAGVILDKLGIEDSDENIWLVFDYFDVEAFRQAVEGESDAKV